MYIRIHKLAQLCCRICINISMLGYILPADPAVSLCQARFLAAAELCSNYASAPGCGTQTASVSLGCSLPRCLGKAPILLPALPARQCPGVGLRLAQCPSGSRSDRRAKEGEPAGRAAGPLEVTALPGSLRCLAAPSLAWQGQPYLCRLWQAAAAMPGDGTSPPFRSRLRSDEAEHTLSLCSAVVGGLMVSLQSSA